MHAERFAEWRHRGALLLATSTLIACSAICSTASASGPTLQTPRADLDAAMKCPIHPSASSKTPLMFIGGTGASGDTAWLLVGDAFEALGHPVCYVNFPANMTADMQIAVEYVVYTLRREYALAGRRVAVFGTSQGAVLPRFALTYWPDLRRKVSDLVAVAGTHHGTTVFNYCSTANPCEPARWQQRRPSALLTALNSQPDETPGRVSYTTVRTLTDETVQPQGGPRPTSALEGARNIAIQDICPGRSTRHIGAVVDSVAWAAFVDAIHHAGKGQRGAASTARFPADVCTHPYAPGLNELTTSVFLGLSRTVVRGGNNPKVTAEPAVRPIFRKPTG